MFSLADGDHIYEKVKQLILVSKTTYFTEQYNLF